MTLWEALDDPVGLSEALVTLGRQVLMSSRPRSAEPPARRAVAVLDGAPPGYPRVLAEMFLGAQLVLTDQPAAALPHLEEALALALAHSDDMIALCRSYVGLAQAAVAGPRAAEQLVKSLEPTATPLHHERRVRVLRNVADGMRRLGRWQDERRYMAAAIDETSRFDPVVPVLEFHARHWALVADGGDWAAAEAGLRAMLEPGRTVRGGLHGRLHGAARAGPHPGAERAGRRGPPDARRRLGARPRGRRPRRAGAHRDRPGRAWRGSPAGTTAGGRPRRSCSRGPTGPATRITGASCCASCGASVSRYPGRRAPGMGRWGRRPPPNGSAAANRTNARWS